MSKRESHLSAFGNIDVDLGLVVGAHRYVFDLPEDEEAVDDSAEDDVLPIQELTLGAGDEELATV
jgi:hypothetical protein